MGIETRFPLTVHRHRFITVNERSEYPDYGVDAGLNNFSMTH